MSNLKRFDVLFIKNNHISEKIKNATKGINVIKENELVITTVFQFDRT